MLQGPPGLPASSTLREVQTCAPEVAECGHWSLAPNTKFLLCQKTSVPSGQSLSHPVSSHLSLLTCKMGIKILTQQGDCEGQMKSCASNNQHRAQPTGHTCKASFPEARLSGQNILYIMWEPAGHLPPPACHPQSLQCGGSGGSPQPPSHPPSSRRPEREAKGSLSCRAPTNAGQPSGMNGPASRPSSPPLGINLSYRHVMLPSMGSQRVGHD